MNWGNIFQQHKQLLLAIAGSLVVVVIVTVSIQWLFFGSLYVRVVDTTAAGREASDAPGADINAFEIKTAKGKSYYAVSVESSRLGSTDEGIENSHTSTNAVLENPDQETPAQYLSLGHGGEVVVKLPRRLREGDSLIVYEIGQSSGPRAETYDIYTSSDPNGDWQLLGHGAGIYGIVQPNSP